MSECRIQDPPVSICMAPPHRVVVIVAIALLQVDRLVVDPHQHPRPIAVPVLECVNLVDYAESIATSTPDTPAPVMEASADTTNEP